MSKRNLFLTPFSSFFLSATEGFVSHALFVLSSFINAGRFGIFLFHLVLNQEKLLTCSFACLAFVLRNIARRPCQGINMQIRRRGLFVVATVVLRHGNLSVSGLCDVDQ